jgi:GTP cyclohydrolase II
MKKHWLHFLDWAFGDFIAAKRDALVSLVLKEIAASQLAVEVRVQESRVGNSMATDRIEEAIKQTQQSLIMEIAKQHRENQAGVESSISSIGKSIETEFSKQASAIHLAASGSDAVILERLDGLNSKLESLPHDIPLRTSEAQQNGNVYFLRPPKDFNRNDRQL